MTGIEAESGASPASASRSSRRLDIQGLRAFAVLAVMAFHARLPIPGGFAGVDVFFVISGFVITQMLHREFTRTGRIDFGAFYLRRFKRLTPALALVVLVALMLSLLLLSPWGELQAAASTGLGAMLLVANIVIARTTGGYFDEPAELNPLLNTWSLSVEEQFYLVFPALLAIAWIFARRFRRRWIPAVAVGAAAMVSFAGPVLLAIRAIDPRLEIGFGFYGTFGRAWEFGVGALVALGAGTLSRLPKPSSELAALAGAVLLISSLWLITPATTPYPGPWTALPVLGTALVIAAGCAETGLLGRVLAMRPAVVIGDWSYSLYLWHWPLIVFAGLLWPLSSHVALIAALFSFLPAVLSYRYLEQPLRALPRISPGRTGALIAAVVLPPVLIAGSVLSGPGNYWKSLFESGRIAAINPGEIGKDPVFTYIETHYYPCADEAVRSVAIETDGVERCYQSKDDSGVQVALLGDSHADHLFVGLAEALPQANVASYFQPALPVRGTAQFDVILDRIMADPHISTVVLSAFWAERGIPTAELGQVLDQLEAAGKRVVITDDVPDFPFQPFQCAYRKALLLSPECALDRAAVENRRSGISDQLQGLVSERPNVQLVSTAESFCTADGCSMAPGGRLLYRDPDHLNLAGSRTVAEEILRQVPGLARLAPPEESTTTG